MPRDWDDEDYMPVVKKRRQVALACTICRARKIKCSGEAPCTRCAKAGTECVFEAPAPKRSEMELAQLRGELAELRGMLLRAAGSQATPAATPPSAGQSSDPESACTPPVLPPTVSPAARLVNQYMATTNRATLMIDEDWPLSQGARLAIQWASQQAFSLEGRCVTPDQLVVQGIIATLGPLEGLQGEADRAYERAFLLSSLLLKSAIGLTRALLSGLSVLVCAAFVRDEHQRAMPLVKTIETMRGAMGLQNADPFMSSAFFMEHIPYFALRFDLEVSSEVADFAQSLGRPQPPFGMPLLHPEMLNDCFSDPQSVRKAADEMVQRKAQFTDPATMDQASFANFVSCLTGQCVGMAWVLTQLPRSIETISNDQDWWRLMNTAMDTVTLLVRTNAFGVATGAMASALKVSAGIMMAMRARPDAPAQFQTGLGLVRMAMCLASGGDPRLTMTPVVAYGLLTGAAFLCMYDADNAADNQVVLATIEHMHLYPFFRKFLQAMQDLAQGPPPAAMAMTMATSVLDQPPMESVFELHT